MPASRLFLTSSAKALAVMAMMGMVRPSGFAPLRIVRVAEENKVEVVENVPLARALYAQTELDREIPPELYGAVAEVLVYIFKLSKKQL